MVQGPSPQRGYECVNVRHGGRARSEKIIVCYSSWGPGSLEVHTGPRLSGLGPIQTEPKALCERQSGLRERRRTRWSLVVLQCLIRLQERMSKDGVGGNATRTLRLLH